MVSGGSALQLLDYVDVEVLGAHITLTTLDERFTTDPFGNNYELLSQTIFFAEATTRGATVLPTVVRSGESLSDFASRLDRGLTTWRNNHPTGVIIATMGIGSDGHTAGLFKDVVETVYESDNVLGQRIAEDSHDYPHRVTVTAKFLRSNIAAAVALAAGESKREIINTLLQNIRLGHIPAAVLLDMNDVHLFY
jgi:6-phosphogluconolactonase/glucosamine-6-phosphate isomerase/deaminase